jgi:hypothetical protein
MWLEPEMRVHLNKPIALTDFMKTRYDHGRCFGGMRVRNASHLVRVWRTASIALVPVVQVWRWSRGFWPKRRQRLRFVLTLPAQFAMFSVWAYGEAWGYLRGPGRSCERLFY